jgi:TPR repeat protein
MGTKISTLEKNLLKAIKLDKNNAVALYELGNYYENQKDYVKMVKYYDKAAELNDLDSIVKLGRYYFHLDYKKSVEYHSKASDLGRIESTYIVAKYWYHWRNDNTIFKKYCVIAIKQNHIPAILLMANYHRDRTFKVEKMKKFLLMAVDLNSISAMTELARYYKSHENYLLMEKYLLMATNLQDRSSIYELSDYYIDKGDINKGLDLLFGYKKVAPRETEFVMQRANRAINRITKDSNRAKSLLLEQKIGLTEYHEFMNNNSIVISEQNLNEIQLYNKAN